MKIGAGMTNPPTLVIPVKLVLEGINRGTGIQKIFIFRGVLVGHGCLDIGDWNYLENNFFKSLPTSLCQREG
jgi:hypothetical protein